MKKCRAIFDPSGAAVECNRAAGHSGKHQSAPSEWECQGESDPQLPGRWRMRWKKARRESPEFVKAS